ncbi:VOC family protein (plasmid) [Streptomyces sp. BI20]|uniref:VOC family protein n=1 Tax=Streptomyces sp. BI20 TaxID=3403460 RepID=UPI003C71DDC2
MSTTDPTGTPTVDPAPQVWPTLRARDARALIAFLHDALGFEETVVYGEGDEVHHAELSWPAGGGLMLGSGPKGEADDAWPLRPGTFGCYLVVAREEDTDALCARARAAGAEITAEPHTTDYGSRDFAMRDPEGNLYSVGSYRGAPRPAPAA